MHIKCINHMHDRELCSMFHMQVPVSLLTHTFQSSLLFHVEKHQLDTYHQPGSIKFIGFIPENISMEGIGIQNLKQMIWQLVA